MYRFFIYIILFTLSCRYASGQTGTELLKTIPIKAAFMAVDDLGNVYLVRKEDNSLVRYTADGDSSNFFRTISNGNIGFVDATNPLRILLYYPRYSKVVLLDRMMGIKNELNLNTVGILKPTAIAASTDGGIWVYDQFNGKLKKLNEQLEVLYESNDLRQQLDRVPNTHYMLEKNRNLYMADSAAGILIFDRYANYVNMIAISGLNEVQVFDDRFVYRKASDLESYDYKTIKTQQLPLPVNEEKLLQVKIIRDRLYLLLEDRLEIYIVR